MFNKIIKKYAVKLVQCTKCNVKTLHLNITYIHTYVHMFVTLKVTNFFVDYIDVAYFADASYLSFLLQYSTFYLSFFCFLCYKFSVRCHSSRYADSCCSYFAALYYIYNHVSSGDPSHTTTNYLFPSFFSSQRISSTSQSLL